MPKVSILMATYNCAQFVVQALRSALDQTFRDFEIIVVDDGSTDDTAIRLRQFGDNIRYIYQANSGPSAAHNLALAHSSGQYIAFLNSDDIWAREKLEEQIAYLDTHPEVGIVHTGFYEIDESGNILRIKRSYEKDIIEGNCLLLLFEKRLLQSSVMVRREWLFRVGLLDAWASPSDRELYVRLAASGCVFGYIPTPLWSYRLRRGSVTQASSWRLLEAQAYTYQRYLGWLRRSDVKKDPDLMRSVEKKLDEIRFKLSRHYRIKGQRRRALRTLLPLILKRPWRTKYFVRLASILLPSPLLRKARVTFSGDEKV